MSPRSTLGTVNPWRSTSELNRYTSLSSSKYRKTRQRTSEDFISFGSGEPPASEYHSFVLYHNNSPRWSELLKLPIPVDKFRGAHIRFEFRHCSKEIAKYKEEGKILAKEKGEKKLFGFSFVPLMQEDGRTLPDGTHELIVHKVTSVRWWR
ncbi:Dedicator of cytokinesis protein 4 [Saguinus oedipus]|uniref:Dedicator of cytokinesis protein 4 n=1 Tax=Saguinus oedipus TaxID=9490 RepID=A0ABQ9UHC4_SAGOE|nr:Dedicator of cytokinesis protein 4 [Saguinus oedipus]